MAEEQEAYLKAHAKYFDGLLSLIPANLYYEQDRSDQWQRKKQTKEQARAAKRAKLDPTNAKSVKDVIDINEQKRKREPDSQDEVLNGIRPEKPKEGLKEPRSVAKKHKKEGPSNPDSSKVGETTDASIARKLRAESKEAKKERKRALQEKKREEKRQRLAEKIKRRVSAAEASAQQGDGKGSKRDENGGEFESSEFGGLSEGNAEGSAAASNGSQSSKDDSPLFDGAAIQSGTSSISSIPDAVMGTTEQIKSPISNSIPKPTHEELKVRLQKRLAELRRARKAEKDDGTPTISRQQLLEQRREKEAQRKAHKKALRKAAKEEEQRKREEDIARGSPLMSPAINSPAGKHGLSAPTNSVNNFAFGKIAFENGQTMSAGLDTVLDPQKKQLPHHAKLALQAAERHQEKLTALNPEQRAELATKDLWVVAQKRASGEKVRDDTSLLKKTLKRKEKQKKKSEKEWNARIQGVAQSQEVRQKKREENIQKRKEGKGGKGKSLGGKKTKSKARPGFEGSFRAGGKGK